MLIQGEYLESILWAEDCIKGNKRGKGEVEHLKNLLKLIEILSKDDKKL
jgi:hypothetical protein